MNIRLRRSLVALLPAMMVPFVASLFYFVLFKDGAVARTLYSMAKLYLVVWPMLCLWLIYKEKLPRLTHSETQIRSIPLGVVTGLLIVGFVLILMKTPLRGLFDEAGINIKAKCEVLGILEHYWFFAVFISVIHSFIEEYYWRWFVYGRLRTIIPFKSSVVLASLAFASHHVVIVTQFFPAPWSYIFGLAVGVGGGLWCVMLERQRSLVGIWISHMLVDFGVMAVGYYMLMR